MNYISLNVEILLQNHFVLCLDMPCLVPFLLAITKARVTFSFLP
jgi:hypothetical protein